MSDWKTDSIKERGEKLHAIGFSLQEAINFSQIMRAYQIWAYDCGEMSGLMSPNDKAVLETYFGVGERASLSVSEIEEHHIVCATDTLETILNYWTQRLFLFWQHVRSFSG